MPEVDDELLEKELKAVNAAIAKSGEVTVTGLPAGSLDNMIYKKELEKIKK